MALTQVIRRMNGESHPAIWRDDKGYPCVPHGFRSTFRDWAAERTNFPNEVVEMAIAHAVGDKVEAAYRRGDLFEKRRRLMNAWEKFVTTAPKAGTGTIIEKQEAA
jgi:integrase